MTEPFFMGGEDSEDHFDASMRYRSSLQNFLIDTGSKVILVDTGMHNKETPDAIPDEKTTIYGSTHQGLCACSCGTRLQAGTGQQDSGNARARRPHRGAAQFSQRYNMHWPRRRR